MRRARPTARERGLWPRGHGPFDGDGAHAGEAAALAGGGGVYLLNEYLEVYRRYARRSSRYYFYRGSLYGAREALEIWAEEHGGSGGALA